jgi:hypothetical protein
VIYYSLLGTAVHRFRGVRFTAFIVGMAATLSAQPHIDNVLVQMVPPGTNSLIGAHMDQIKRTEIYRKAIASRVLVQVDEFANETGFDPRRDVRELLLASNPHSSVMLARGTFHLNPASLKGVKQLRHGQYVIYTHGGAGFCVLDSTLAAAGELKSLEAALDEWTSGTHKAAEPLLAMAAGISPQSQFWGVSKAAGQFIADHPPSVGAPGGVDVTKVFRGLQDTWFDADFSSGAGATLHGNTATEKDAMNLRDAFRGVIGLGRLNVPDNEPELLRVFDGITVDQQGRAITIHASVAQDLVDKMVEMLTAQPARRLL